VDDLKKLIELDIPLQDLMEKTVESIYKK
jgi:hypothetical protein